MTTIKVRADYEQLAAMANIFSQQAESTGQVYMALRRQVAVLQGGQWVGQNADTFYREMNAELWPALSRLAGALKEAAGTTQKISQLMKRAEDEAAALFRLDGAGGGATVDQTRALASAGALMATQVAAGPGKPTTRRRKPRKKGKVVRVERENVFKRRPPGPGAYTDAEYQNWRDRHPYAGETTDYIYPGQSDKEKNLTPEAMWKKGYFYSGIGIDADTGKPAEIWLSNEADQEKGEVIKIVRTVP